MPKSLMVFIACQLAALTAFVAAPRAEEARIGPPPDAENRYVGVDTCAECHKKNFISWKKSGHRTTFLTLKLPMREKPECLKCHTTGYGHPTGFVSLEKTPQLATVGCESCHGPGGAHVDLMKTNPEGKGITDFKIDAPRRASCVDCHKFHRHF